MLARVLPERGVEGLADQTRVADAEPWLAGCRSSPESDPPQAVPRKPNHPGWSRVPARCRSDPPTGWPGDGQLPQSLKQFLADLGPVAAHEGHLKLAEAGPVARDAMLTNRMICRVAVEASPRSSTKTWAWGSAAPKTLPPLKS